MKKIILFLFAALCGMASSPAALILSDTFSYPDGDISAAPGSPWMVHSGTTPANVQSGALRLTGGNSADVNALLSGQPYLSNSAAVVYSSFKVRFTSAPGILGTYFAHFKDTNANQFSGFGGRVWVSATNAIAGGTLTGSRFRLGIGNGTSANAASGQMDQDLELNTNYTVVTRFVPNTGAATLWLNPAAESDSSVTATDTGTPTRPNPIDVVSYAFRQASGIGAVLIDDLRVGTTFDDVAGTNNSPSISSIPAQRVTAGAPTPAIPFTVGDAETASDALVPAGVSLNQTLVPDANIVFGGSGSNRTVTVTPAAGQQGVALITVSITDGNGATASSTFQLSVGVPTISDIPSQITPRNATLAAVSFTIDDAESPASSLNVSAISSNQGLVPDGNIALGGAGADRTITITPAADAAGLATITVTVTDGTTSTSDTFPLTVNPLLGVLRSDDFNRPDGPLVLLDGQWLSNGGTGGTNLQQMQVVSEQARVNEDQSEDVSTELPPGQPSVPTYAPASGTIFYAGMTINLSKLPGSAGGYFVHFRDGGNGFRGRLFVSTSGAAAGRFRLGIANNAATIGTGGQIPADLATNTTYPIVVRYNVATGESKLWLNAESESSPGVSAPDAPSPIEVQAFTFRQNAGIGVVCVDDLKIATSFAEVAPPVAPSLDIVRTGNAVEVSWPASAAGYVLQSSADPATPSSWQDVSPQPPAVGDRFVLSVPSPTDNLFYRLRKP